MTAKELVLNDEQKKILSVLGDAKEPASGKEVAEASGLDGKLVTKHINKLKTAGYVDSPVRCKYSVTEAGKTAIS